MSRHDNLSPRPSTATPPLAGLARFAPALIVVASLCASGGLVSARFQSWALPVGLAIGSVALGLAGALLAHAFLHSLAPGFRRLEAPYPAAGDGPSPAPLEPGRSADPVAAKPLEPPAPEPTLDELLRNLDQARSNEDAELVMAIRELAAPRLSPTEIAQLDEDLFTWFMHWLQNRLRKVGVDLELVELATRVADSFSAHAQAAGLRSALPTLRRSAGLCAKCGRPFTGVADVCPFCRAGLKIADPEAPAAVNEPLPQAADRSAESYAEDETISDENPDDWPFLET